MEKKGAKQDGEAMASGASEHRYSGTPGETAAAARRGQPATEREPQQRRAPKKRRESLHTWIVHFDAERSARPPASNEEK
ncbi:hypothetical protein BJG93_31590 (plasmid) [Paraburkholderia sprentiae WSM5005]|uniref:Uncharacterized protein n=1 Tax=Paraburkholderia sprentiae WSM5005 TaxID=754502 RepID=A0A1I9YUV4_9BURK|nr:hypothetical protein [Paraburkholderia sprentiae]APA89974.2 hypothetical protein BJG93_31590 [Paraburkholderia sprentiae WSM5005]